MPHGFNKELMEIAMEYAGISLLLKVVEYYSGEPVGTNFNHLFFLIVNYWLIIKKSMLQIYSYADLQWVRG